jgi:hypothetical protein
MKLIDVLMAVLVVVGALNWGLVGFANFDLVKTTFGDMSMFSRVVYGLVGIAGLYQAVQWKAIRHRWQAA